MALENCDLRYQEAPANRDVVTIQGQEFGEFDVEKRNHSGSKGARSFAENVSALMGKNDVMQFRFDLSQSQARSLCGNDYIVPIATYLNPRQPSGSQDLFDLVKGDV